MREAGSLHDFAYGHAFKPAFAEQAGRLLQDPFMPDGGLFGGVAHLFCILDL
jgi:hypothetical protein